MTSAVSLQKVSRHFGAVKAMDEVDLEIAPGEFFAMLGPSGSGKTTCLRLIAGFEQPTAGHIEIFGERGRGRAALSPQRQHGVPGLRAVPAPQCARQRRLLADAQEGSARPSGTSRPKRRSRWCGSPAMARASRASFPAGSGSAWRWPARIVNQPKVLLLDEPLGALDLKLREIDAGGAEGAAEEPRHHLHLRHPRPGRSAVDGRPRRRVQRRQDACRSARPRRSTSGRSRASSPISSARPTCCRRSSSTGIVRRAALGQSCGPKQST